MRRFGVRIPTSAQKEDFKFEALFFCLKVELVGHVGPVDARIYLASQNPNKKIFKYNNAYFSEKMRNR